MNPKPIVGSLLLATVGVVLLLGLLAPEAAAGTTPPVNLSGSGSGARFPALARAADGTLCAAWSDNRDGAWNIYSACSIHNGQLWETPVRVASTSLTSTYPVVLFSGTVPLVFWTENNANKVFTIYQKTDTDVEVAVPGILLPIPRPSVARAEDGSLHLVFANWPSADERTGDIYYTRRPATGEWLSATVIFTHTLFGSMDPRIAVGPEGTLHVVWRETPSLSGDEIRYMTGTVGAGGAVTWSPSVTASDVVSLAWGPDIAVAPNGNAHIVWTEKSGADRYLAYTRFSAGGGRIPPRRLGGPFSVNQNNPYHLAPAIAATGERVCIAWNSVPGGASAEDVFLICSEDGGETWSPPENLSRTPAMSLRPSIAIAPDGSVHVVWQEFSGTNYDTDYRVYYTRWLPHSVYLPLVMRNAR
jgi:hypothetical protein